MEAVFFDFDGVILDSVNIKTEAFGELFAEYGEDIRQKVIEYHLQHGGVSRFDKFVYYYSKLLGEEIDATKLERLGEAFTELTLKKILEVDFMPGALETLKGLKKLGIPAFIASGTPQNDLDAILRARALDVFFVEAHGTPLTKLEIITDVVPKRGFNVSRCLFIGDAMADYDAAKASGMPFLGVVSKTSIDFPQGTTVTEVLSLKVLKQAVQR